MDALLKDLSAKQLRALLRYCYLYQKPLTVPTVQSWIQHRARCY